MKPNFYINIGRELGSGGFEIGEKLAKVFDIPFYDKELINVASKESGISKEFFEKADEVYNQKFSSGYFGINFSSIFSDISSSSVLDNEELFRIQSNVIKNVASQGAAVFVGRCADYILRDEQNCLNVFITAPINCRISRLRDNKKFKGIEKFSDTQMEEYLQKVDKRRSNYYNYFTYKRWGMASSYNLCLDSSLLGVDRCVEIIGTIVREQFINK